MNVVDVMGLCKSFGARKILDGVTFAIGEDERVGIIGANGAGKSTLFAILSGMDDSEGGSIVMKRGASVGYLCQEPVLDEESTVAQEIEGGLREIRKAMSAFHEISERLASNPSDMDRLLARQGELTVWIEHHGGWNTDHRVSEMMTHLNLPDPDQKIGTLSGGTKRRVALAKLLLQAPELLLLDEPTNHLDADTTQWLQEHLKKYPGAVMLITHDRYFLDEVVTRMLELEDGVITSYQGGYSLYLEQREERLMGEARTRSRLLNLLRNETAWIRRGAKARTTKQKARIDRYNDLRDECDQPVQRNLTLGFTTEEGLGGTILEMEGVAKGYDSRTLINTLTFGMKRGDRVGVIGPNGCGKTTLIRMIMGEETPDRGNVVVGKKTRISYFDQLREVIDPNETIYDFFGEGDYVTCGGQKRHKMGYLEEFLFAPEDRRRPIGSLSGGEKSRLILARLMLQDSNLLVLDEPTNDLDIPTLQLLDASLASFPGCVLMVTHDRFFLDKVATGILAFEGEGKVVFYEGNYSNYRERKEALKAAAAEARTEKRDPAQPAKPERPKKGLTYNERLELERLEEAIAVQERELGEVESQLADPSSYASVEGGIAAISAKYSQLEAQLAASYERWEELETKKGQ